MAGQPGFIPSGLEVAVETLGSGEGELIERVCEIPLGVDVRGA